MDHRNADVLILGAGIAGFETFRSLTRQFKKLGINKKIKIVDKNNYFTFTPLLHEVATGAVLSHHASFAIREIIAGTPHEFISGTVQSIDPTKNIVTTDTCTIEYETCVVALGSVSNLYNTPGAEDYTYRVRTLEQALNLNQSILQLLEEPNRTTLSINIVGGGYTGVEIAAEFAHLKQKELSAMYPNVDISIHIIQAGKSVVPALPKKARKKIQKRLKSLHVNTHLNTKATKVTKETLTLEPGKSLPNDITIWVAGFTTIAYKLFEPVFIERDRVPVNNNLHIANHPNTYVIGDMALIRDPDNNDITYPQLGEAAHMEGEYVAKHIMATIKKKMIHHFHFKAKGTLIPIGSWYGVAIMGPIIFTGKFAWWLRRTVYVLFMPGVIRKLRIIMDWTFISKSGRHLIRIKKK